MIGKNVFGNFPNTMHKVGCSARSAGKKKKNQTNNSNEQRLLKMFSRIFQNICTKVNFSLF
jgi:hypothetical protein